MRNHEKDHSAIAGADSTVLSEDQKFRLGINHGQCSLDDRSDTVARSTHHHCRLYRSGGRHRERPQSDGHKKRRETVMQFDTAQRISTATGMALIVLLQIQREEVIKTIVLAGLGGMASYLFTLILKLLILYLKKKWK